MVADTPLLPPRLVLASGSPRRRALLGRLGSPFVVMPSAVPEDPWDAHDTPRRYVEAQAVRKARDVAERLSRSPKAAPWSAHAVLGADTVAWIEGAVIGKPATPAEATAILSRLSGTAHEVWTGVAVARAQPGEPVTATVAAERAVVRFRELSTDAIAAYVATGEPLGKAGAFALQETGHRFVASLQGAVDCVVGLPLGLCARLLVEHNLPFPVGVPAPRLP